MDYPVIVLTRCMSLLVLSRLNSLFDGSLPALPAFSIVSCPVLGLQRPQDELIKGSFLLYRKIKHSKNNLESKEARQRNPCTQM
jgi:hypothetical protein